MAKVVLGTPQTLALTTQEQIAPVWPLRPQVSQTGLRSQVAVSHHIAGLILLPDQRGPITP